MNRDDKDADNDMPEQIENASSQGFTLDPKVMADAEAPVLVMDAQGTPLFANKNAMSFANGIREGLFPEMNF